MRALLNKLQLPVSVLIFSLVIFASCSDWVIPSELPGIYTGKQRILMRFNKGGQHIFKEDSVLVSIDIDKSGHISGMVGEATLEKCILKPNRGWVGRQLNLKTDFIISGKLEGKTFEKDTFLLKDISIPFKVENQLLKGSLFIAAPQEQFPMIRFLALEKR